MATVRMTPSPLTPVPSDDSTYLGGLLHRGEVIGGWQIQDKLAVTSGEAEIYLADRGGQTAVVKYYRNQIRPDQATLGLIQGWQHPGIIGILSFGDHQGDFYEIMEYAAGGSLEQRKLTEDQASGFLATVTEALARCHQGGLIHRDVKPANIYCRTKDGGSFVLGDFGIASLVSKGTKLMTQNGNRTEGYAAPELYLGVVGVETDWYALGVTTWEVLTGTEAFAGMLTQHLMNETARGRMADHLLSRPEATDVSPRFQTLIRGLLTHPRDQRWTEHQIRRWLSGDTVVVFSGPIAQPTRPFEVAGISCSSLPEVAQALLDHPAEGARKVLRRHLEGWLSSFDDDFTKRISDLVDTLDGQPESRIVRRVALALDPTRPFTCGDGTAVANLNDLADVLSRQRESVIPHLCDPTDLLWDYLAHWEAGAIADALLPVLGTVTSQARLGNIVLVAMWGQVIRPFTGRFADTELSRLDQLKDLPQDLRVRFLLDLEDRHGLLAVWLEEVSGRGYPPEWVDGLPSWDAVVGYWLGNQPATKPTSRVIPPPPKPAAKTVGPTAPPTASASAKVPPAPVNLVRSFALAVGAVAALVALVVGLLVVLLPVPQQEQPKVAPLSIKAPEATPAPQAKSAPQTKTAPKQQELAKLQKKDADIQKLIQDIGNRIESDVPTKSTHPLPALEKVQRLATAAQAKASNGLVLVEGGMVTVSKASVEVHPLLVSALVVTQKQYQATMGTNPSHFRGPDLPVENVSWYDAVEYCNQRSLQEGLSQAYTIDKETPDPNNRNADDPFKWTVRPVSGSTGYRLPTEAELLWVSLGGSKGRGLLYPGSDTLDEVGWYQGNSDGSTHPVAAKTANELGLYDLSGNVFQWCWNWLGGASSGSIRVLRGGGWSSGPEYCAVQGKKLAIDPFTKNDKIGIRVVRSR